MYDELNSAGFEKELSGFLHKTKISKQELLAYLLDSEKNIEKIPIGIFNNNLAPLESLVFYLKSEGKGINEISRILKKNHSSISLAYKNAKNKQKSFSKESRYFIPLTEFSIYSKLSILEIVVNYLKKNNLSFSQISEILKRDYKTIWTLFSRAERKIKWGKK